LYTSKEHFRCERKLSKRPERPAQKQYDSEHILYTVPKRSYVMYIFLKITFKNLFTKIYQNRFRRFKHRILSAFLSST